MLEYAECNFVPLSSGFSEICQSVLRNDPVTTEKFYACEILFSGQFKKEGGGCMTELQINFTVFTLASFLISQGLCFLGEWASHSFLSLLHTPHGQQMLAVCVPGWYWYRNTPLYCFDRCGSISGREFDKHTCGRDHLLLMTGTFLQPAVRGINGLSWIHCVCVCVGGMAIPHSKCCFDKDLENSPIHEVD